MTINKHTSDDGTKTTISIEGRFDFSLHQRFREVYSNEQCKKMVLDLSLTSYMDSSALGMILLVKDYMENLGGEVMITNPNENVLKILQIAQFHRLFTIAK